MLVLDVKNLSMIILKDFAMINIYIRSQSLANFVKGLACYY